MAFRLSLIVLLATAPAAGEAGSRANALVTRGDTLFAKGNDARTTWKAIGFYKEAFKLQPRGIDALWRLARAYNWLIDVVADSSRHGALAKKGYGYALLAIAHHPKRVEGHYYAAICIGAYGKTLGVFTALRKGIGGKFRRHLDAALRIDRAFDDGGVDRLYAMFHHMVPWPLKSRKKAYQHFNRALRASPSCPLTHWCMAQVLLKDDRTTDARRHLRRCADPTSKWRGERMRNLKAQRQCRGLLR